MTDNTDNIDPTNAPAVTADPGMEKTLCEMALPADASAIARLFDWREGELRELRCLAPASRAVKSIFVDSAEEACRQAERFSGTHHVYITVNPCRRGEGKTTADVDITRRALLFVDVDPQRASGTMASDEQVQLALARLGALQEELAARSWPLPSLVASGNGWHAYWRIEGVDAMSGVFKQVLDAMNLRHGDDVVKIDTTVHNAARITRFPGTLNIKGGADPRSCLLLQLGDAEPLHASQLDQLVQEWAPAKASAKASAKAPAKAKAKAKAFDLAAFIQKHGIEVQDGPKAWVSKDLGKGIKWHITCPFNAEHGSQNDVMLFQVTEPGDKQGTIVFKCQHASCSDRTWADVREKFEPGYDQGGGGGDAERVDQLNRVLRFARERWIFGSSSGNAYAFRNGVTSDMGEGFLHQVECDWEAEQGVAPWPAAAGQACEYLARHARKGKSQWVLGPRWARPDEHRERVLVDVDGLGRALEVDGSGWREVAVTEPVFLPSTDTQREFHARRAAKCSENPAEALLSTLALHVNLPRPELCLLAGWMLTSCLSVNRPTLYLYGPPRSGKTTACKLIKQVLDPVATDSEVTQTTQKTDDLVATLEGSGLVLLDNMNKFTAEQWQLFCAVATGGAYNKRSLFTDNKLFTVHLRRSVVLSSVNLDFPDENRRRLLSIGFEQVDSSKEGSFTRLQEGPWEAELRGLLLDALSMVLRRLPEVKARGEVTDGGGFLEFAQVLHAFGDELDGEGLALVRCWLDGQEAGRAEALEGDSVVEALERMMRDRNLAPWSGKRGDLFNTLRARMPHGCKDAAWNNAPALTNALLRMEGGLQHRGFRVIRPRSTNNTKPSGQWHIEWIPPTPPAPSTEAQESLEQAFRDIVEGTGGVQ